MTKRNVLPVLTVAFAALVPGSLAILSLSMAREPIPPDCRAEIAARAAPEPGFVALAGKGDPACLKVRR